MKRTLWPLAVLPFVLCGCSGSTTAMTPSSSELPETPNGATATVLPDTPDGATEIACDDVTFIIEPTLASGHTCEIIPEFDNDTVGNPRYLRITLEGYPLSGASWSPEISVYPVAEFSAMVDTVPGIVANLEASISGDGPVANDLGELPFLLNQDQGQFFNAQYQVVPFASGKGIRYLTGFTQDMGVFSNPLIYTYQAMTDDARFWISANFPTSHPTLPNDANWPPDGMTEDEFFSNYDTYLTDNVDELNAQLPGSFSPTLDDLDAFVSGITVSS